MKVVLLAGGLGTRLSEETGTRPKPMVEIGAYPILWHIMNIYGAHGFDEFIVLCGHKGEFIKEYFADFHLRYEDFTVHLKDGMREVVASRAPDWKVTCLDTGAQTMTGGRIRRAAPHLTSTFMCTYGDGLGDIDISRLVDFHRSHGRLATLTAVHPTARFGALEIASEEKGDRVREFAEKPQSSAGWINGGFFVFEPGVIDYIDDDETMLEREPLERLASDGQLMCFKHEGFWQPMDTLREKRMLEALWESGEAPWVPRNRA